MRITPKVQPNLIQTWPRARRDRRGRGGYRGGPYMMELQHRFDHISTGGSALLSLLEGKRLRASKRWK